jgi:periplasmic divalent cation tolerance protein
MNEEYCVICTTFAQEEQGQPLIEALLAEHLAACIQMLPIQSFYRWQGKVNRDQEVLVFIKTLTQHYPKVQDLISAHHPYQMPEIIQIPISAGLPAYLEWMRQECRIGD